MDILKFITAGNIDDGKSTLIGRLLYDTHNIKSDILQSISQTDSAFNLAFITDGLRAEREQGITIDIAYKYFSTPNRKFIITDAPGHFQYTKNLVTGASNVDVMIILIDALHGITDQTKRHSLVASFLGIKHVVVAINKMDLVDYKQSIFEDIKTNYQKITNKLHISNTTFIPISALQGDNISSISDNMGWYNGTTLLEFLESCPLSNKNTELSRFSVQHVINSDTPNRWGYAGKILSGKFRLGDTIVIHPYGENTSITKIINGYSEVKEAYAGENICIYLQNELIAARGDSFSLAHHEPLCNDKIEAIICWLDDKFSMQTGKDYLLRINNAETICKVIKIEYKIDVKTFDKADADRSIEVNEFAKITIETKEPIAYDHFSIVPENGRGILIDIATNNTSAAFIVAQNQF